MASDAPSPYLQRLANHRDQMTTFYGVSLPGVTGGHAAERCFLTDIASPAIAKPAPTPAAQPAPDYTFDDEHTVELQVTGLAIPERVEAFGQLLTRISEAKLLDINFESDTANMAYAAQNRAISRSQLHAIHRVT